jgi:putative ATP-binding cassette transporter
MSIFVVLSSWGNFSIYAFIGLVIFVLADGIPNQSQVMTGFALVFIYMIIPMEVLLQSIPRANLAKVAARRIENITREIPANTEATTQVSKVNDFESLTFSDVTHSYYHEQSNEVFELGPINLAFEPGTVTFLVGGNGSGKTTLAKMIVGLYAPELGQVTLNGELISNQNRDHYRQLFSAVFSDFHLFGHLLEFDRTDLDETGNKLLERLHLQHKVKVVNGAFSTQALSQGQRKRLALIAAYLEDRQFLVFDEWAADQDPVFKDVFYHELLAELKAQGKTILVISHDDKYFDCGDRLLKLENGQLSDITVKHT